MMKPLLVLLALMMLSTVAHAQGAIGKNTDTTPRQVCIQVRYVTAPAADVAAYNANPKTMPEAILAQLFATGHSHAMQTCTMFVPDNARAATMFSRAVLIAGNTGDPNTHVIDINDGVTVTPHINSNGTLTLHLVINSDDPAGTLEEPFTTVSSPPPTSQSLSTSRTIKAGETFLLMGLQSPAENAPVTKEKEKRLFFITANIMINVYIRPSYVH